MPKNISAPEYPKISETKHTKFLKTIIEKNFKDHPGSTNNFWFVTEYNDVIKTVAIIAEGVPESQTRKIIKTEKSTGEPRNRFQKIRLGPKLTGEPRNGFDKKSFWAHPTTRAPGVEQHTARALASRNRGGR